MKRLSYFEKTINIKDSAISFDFRKILGAKNKFSMFIWSNNKTSEYHLNPLGHLSGRSIDVIARSNNKKLFMMSVYISATATEAEGELTIFDKENGGAFSDSLSIELLCKNS